jgi:hypothetical protein
MMTSPLPLGRISPASVPGAWELTRDTVPVAPRLLAGDPPRRSIDLSRFRNTRYRDQVRGTCVGQSGAAMAETTVRTPSPLDESSEPNAPVDLSPLWVYAIARKYSADHGMPGIYDGEGAIVTHALSAVRESGLVRWEAWPGTPENERAYRDGRIPREAADAPKVRAVGDVRILERFAQVLEYLAGGYSVWVGVGWPRAAMSTAADGRFPWSGRTARDGGHAVELLGYDLDRDLVVVGNSWERAGWGGWQGRKNVGYTSLRAFERELSDANLSRGESEACVVSEVEGDWAPKVRSWSEVL